VNNPLHLKNRRTYLDHNASSPMRSCAKQAIVEALDELGGNPSSIHNEGRKARRALDHAREQIARLINAPPSRIVFTSGGTEANNAAIWGVALQSGVGSTIIVSSVEHPSVRRMCTQLETLGFRITRIPVDRDGRLNRDEFRNAVEASPKPALAGVMLANNETGALHDVAGLAAICREARVPFFCDAVQAATTCSLDVEDLDISLLSLSGHKIGGPQGIGCLYVKSGTPFVPHMVGGRQERELRAGTQAVPLVAGFGAAAEATRAERDVLAERLSKFRNDIEEALLQNVSGIQIVASATERVATTTCLLVDGVEGSVLLAALDMEGIAVSSGSACSLGSLDPSPVLLAMGFSAEEARTEVRVSMGHNTTEEEINHFLEVFPEVVERCRLMSPLSDTGRP